MIKSELVQRIAEHNPHLYQRDVENIVNAILDEIVAAKPETDHTRYHSAAELRDNGLKHLRDAVALVDSKAASQEW